MAGLPWALFSHVQRDVGWAQATHSPRRLRAVETGPPQAALSREQERSSRPSAGLVARPLEGRW